MRSLRVISQRTTDSTATTPAKVICCRGAHTVNRPPFFIPAETEAEAIERIYSLTGRSNAGTRGEKRALVALRDALQLDIDIVRTNVVLGQVLAGALDIYWDPHRYVERNTVTLDGLNALLEGATERLRGWITEADRRTTRRTPCPDPRGPTSSQRAPRSRR